MRVPAILLVLAISAPAASAGPVPAPAAVLTPEIDKLNAPAADNCPRTTGHYAKNGSMFRGEPAAPEKLAELPPAIGYMAVYRTVNGCEVPMTVTEYRTGRRP
jgi:hypothetical protein